MNRNTIIFKKLERVYRKDSMHVTVYHLFLTPMWGVMLVLPSTFPLHKTIQKAHVSQTVPLPPTHIKSHIFFFTKALVICLKKKKLLIVVQVTQH